MNIPEETIRKAHDVAARINLGLWSWSDRNYMTEEGFAIIASALHSAQMEERERCAALPEMLADTNQVIRLHLGEMTAQEMRTAKAALKWAAAAIRTTKAD